MPGCGGWGASAPLGGVKTRPSAQAEKLQTQALWLLEDRPVATALGHSGAGSGQLCPRVQPHTTSPKSGKSLQRGLASLESGCYVNLGKHLNLSGP